MAISISIDPRNFQIRLFFIENYYKMCVAIIMADPVYESEYAEMSQLGELADEVNNLQHVLTVISLAYQTASTNNFQVKILIQ